MNGDLEIARISVDREEFDQADKNLSSHIELSQKSRVDSKSDKPLFISRANILLSTLKKNIFSLKSSKNLIGNILLRSGKINIEQLKLEADVGPLKYVAELIYGDNAKDHFDSAVRIIILILIFVFDPLAIVLVIAANLSFKERSGQLITPVKLDDDVVDIKRVEVLDTNDRYVLVPKLADSHKILRADTDSNSATWTCLL